MAEYDGIDEREINCSCSSEICVSGICVEKEDEGVYILHVYYGDILKGNSRIFQQRKSVYLNDETRKLLIKRLKNI